MLFRRTRVPALLFGAAFHLGILATMELGWFVPYVLCLYVPLLPWDRWLGGEAHKMSPLFVGQASRLSWTSEDAGPT